MVSRVATKHLLTGSDVIAAFGDDNTAMLMCGPHSTLVNSAPTGLSSFFRGPGEQDRGPAGPPGGVPLTLPPDPGDELVIEGDESLPASRH